MNNELTRVLSYLILNKIDKIVKTDGLQYLSYLLSHVSKT